MADAPLVAVICGSRSDLPTLRGCFDVLDGYAIWRNKENWTWIKEVEILRQFFAFCIDRDWTLVHDVTIVQ